MASPARERKKEELLICSDFLKMNEYERKEKICIPQG
jgi:hypothetical protein